MASRIWASLFPKNPPKSRRGQADLQVERLDDRIVPAQLTYWTDGSGDHSWSNADNWDNGIPDPTHVAVFSGTTTRTGTGADPGSGDTILFGFGDNNPPPGHGASNDDCNYDGGSGPVVAGIRSEQGYFGTLRLISGSALTISAAVGDPSTGLQWTTGNIFQSAAGDALVITGGGTGTNNSWTGGTINTSTAQSNLYLNGYSSLQISGSAAALGSNIIIGGDGNGGSTLEFAGQTSTLQVNNNAYILVSNTTSDVGPNRLLFSTDVTQPGTATRGLATGSVDSFIDNYGMVVRSGAGSYQSDLPIKNEAGSYHGAVLDLQSGLRISGRSANKTANYSVDQEGGKIIFENGTTLQAQGVLMAAGQLLTYGAAQANITADAGFTGPLLWVTGGTMQFAADDPTLYGSLRVQGDMGWGGGVYEAYVYGGTGGQGSLLKVDGTLTLGQNAHLHINVVGSLTSQLVWYPIEWGNWNGGLTFDSDGQFTISYRDNGMRITSR
jgi:hypothetical protein